MNKLLRHIISMLLLLVTLTTVGQRRITPVEPSKPVTPQSAARQKEQDKSHVVESRDANGKIVLIDTVTGTEYIDSTAFRIPRMIYPKIYKVTAGVNIWDAAMRCIGQQYGLFGLWGELNMHNRYFPRVEIGLGQASIKPDGMNYRYKGNVAPYLKLGASYNVFYNSDPRYLFLVGVNYGLTPFRYSVHDVTINDSYWGEESTIGVPPQNAFVGYVELTAGVRVNIVDHFSIGWNAVLHTLLHENKARYGEPIYIPGFGKRGSSITANLSVTWDFELNKVEPQSVSK